MKKKILIVLLFAVIKVEAQTSTFSVSDSLFAIGRYKLALKNLDRKDESFIEIKKCFMHLHIENKPEKFDPSDLKSLFRPRPNKKVFKWF